MHYCPIARKNIVRLVVTAIGICCWALLKVPCQADCQGVVGLRLVLDSMTWSVPGRPWSVRVNWPFVFNPASNLGRLVTSRRARKNIVRLFGATLVRVSK